ncbi:MAG: hypothetical protein D6734_05230 [Candidatus Schekmanbacteria bacterium]|nr:MAG: hypothetical protein D6734_05230 [Candidatus Schekmanbacteria bacterium]
MTMLPDVFLNYAYYWRRKWAIEMSELQGPPNPHKMLVDTTRILPSICTSIKKEDGTIITNAKVIGAGFVPKEEHMIKITKIFKEHIKKEGMDAANTVAFGRHELQTKEDRAKMREFQKKSLKLLIEHLYFEKDEAPNKMDFTKLCTIELGNQYPGKPAHTWNYVQENKKGTLLYFTPPVLSYEIRCNIEIHTEGPYFDFIHAVHDVYFGEDPSEMELPTYIFNVEEVYDNSATPQGYGKQIA